MNLTPLEKRFLNDAEFNLLVKAMENMIEKHHFSIQEMREALFLAHYRFQMMNPQLTQFGFSESVSALIKKHGVSL